MIVQMPREFWPLRPGRVLIVINALRRGAERTDGRVLMRVIEGLQQVGFNENFAGRHIQLPCNLAGRLIRRIPARELGRRRGRSTPPLLPHHGARTRRGAR